MLEIISEKIIDDLHKIAIISFVFLIFSTILALVAANEKMSESESESDNNNEQTRDSDINSDIQTPSDSKIKTSEFVKKEIMREKNRKWDI